MRNSVTTWFEQSERPGITFEGDNEMVTLYWGKDLEIYASRDELQHLSEQIEKFLEETKRHVISSR